MKKKKKVKELLNNVLFCSDDSMLNFMSDKLNPTFPYKIEKAHWYLLLLWREEILTDEEFERALIRLKEKTGNDICDCKEGGLNHG